MFDRYLNHTPTFYKWDKFWVGAVPALLVPVLGLGGVYLLTFLNAKYNQHHDFTLPMFFHSLKFTATFMKVATVCAMLNGFTFFFFVKKDYNNAARGAMVITMLMVLAILIKELL